VRTETGRVTETHKPVFLVSVRELVEFSLRTGDLGGERDFVGPDRAQAGIRGHQKVQRSRPEGYQKEVPLVYDIQTEDFTLSIRGRIDGISASGGEVLLEEIKTIQGRWDRTPDPLHWAQAKCYGYIYAKNHGLERIVLQLTYLQLETGELKEFRDTFQFADLRSFFEAASFVYLEWVRECFEWCKLRDQSIQALAFPFSEYRSGQRQIAVAAYKTMARGGNLFIEAPTGIGKTISVLFPAVKALGERKLERVFYLTARTIGRAVAEKAFADLRQSGLRARTVTLTAKEKVCVREGKPCDASTCPFALGYYDRNKAAMREALQQEEITRPVLEVVAQKHQVCPFELSLDISSWVDAVICDYNYVFDPQVYLRRHFGEESGDYAFLVDEAHNLIDRAREMFSAEIDTVEISEVKREIRKVLPGCARALTNLSTAIKKLSGAGKVEVEELGSADSDLDLFGRVSTVEKQSQLPRGAAVLKMERENVRALKEYPEMVTPLLEKAMESAEEWLEKNEPSEFRENFLQLYFRLHSFKRTAELYDERYVTLTEFADGVRLRLFCLDPSYLLGEALKRGKAAVFFSATLAPIEYYRELLGGSENDQVLRLESPYASENLGILVHRRIRTDFKTRNQTLSEVAGAIAALVQKKRGNYLVYFPSFQYLRAVLEQFQSIQPSVSVLVQRPGMDEKEREAFLAAFSAEHGQTLVGFAVMGGIFGEGIDLVGDRLIGAVIVGVGLPQLSVERDLIRDYFQEKTGAGFDYAYAFPGMNRVLQATGRVIRSETDRGMVLLIDARFGERRYQKLFPKWWHCVRVENEEQVRKAAESFWNVES
jgi:DNA excision repair protein ERCC-2